MTAFVIDRAEHCIKKVELVEYAEFGTGEFRIALMSFPFHRRGAHPVVAHAPGPSRLPADNVVLDNVEQCEVGVRVSVGLRLAKTFGNPRIGWSLS